MIVLKRLVKDIRFWIIFFFILRLYGITLPPLEVGHNWRQTTVTMVARNFLEVDNNIFYPRIDIAGEKAGITGMEFPILNYLIYLTAEIFGYEHWYGRIINLIFSSFGLWFFYKLILKYFHQKIAWYATIILCTSIWFQFSRKIMPDTFSLSLVISGIYFGANYLENNDLKNKYGHLFLYFLLILAGVLSKLPSGYILIIFILFIFNKNISMHKKLLFSAVSAIAIIPVVWWYYYWVPFLVEKYGFWHFFMGKSFWEGCIEIAQNLNETLNKFYDVALKFIGFTLFLIGLTISIIKKDFKIYALFTLTFLSFAVIVFKAGITFPMHNYYIIPFVPVMALVAAYGLQNLAKFKWHIIILVAIVIEGIANQHHDFTVKSKDLALLNLEKDLNTFCNPNDLIIINSSEYPTPMYFAHKKGWVNNNSNIANPNFIKDLQFKGLRYIVILKQSFGSPIQLPNYSLLLDNQWYTIYKI
jgi:4-amino-4-deoxy-L-arabinose transferase-like glycosyltransferase